MLTLGLILNLFVFAGIGLGPCLYFFNKNRGLTLPVMLAPICGFVLVSIFGTYLTLRDIPVAMWCLPLVLFAGVTSMVLTIKYASWKQTLRFQINRRWLLSTIGGLLLTTLLVISPLWIGGVQYSTLRGNGTDSFNYTIVAGYLDHEPFSWAMHTDPQTLVDRHPGYERARQLLGTRWTTPMMLAFMSCLAGVPPYQFEYVFSAICFLLAYGPAIMFARYLLRLRPTYTILTASVICFGFWAQLILDMRADSQQCSIPILLLLVFLVVHIETNHEDIAWREYVLIGGTTTALVFHYPEIMPMIIFGLTIYIAIRIVQLRSIPRHVLRGCAIALAIAVACTLPNAEVLLSFAKAQLSFALNGTNNWHLAYFKWLYTDPFTGLWGFGPFVGFNCWIGYILHLIAFMFGVSLTVIFVGAVASIMRSGKEKRGLLLVALLSLTAIAQFVYLFTQGQLWAGAKGLSFGYPYITLCVAGFALRHESYRTAWQFRRTHFLVTCTIGWMLAQVGLAMWRPITAFIGKDYANYISEHGEYRRHNWNVAPFRKIFQTQRRLTVWSDVQNPWVSEYLGLALGWDVNLINLGASRDFAELQAKRQSYRFAKYIIVDNCYGDTKLKIVARTPELILLQLPEDGVLIKSVQNPNGVEGPPASPFFWMGGPATLITFISQRTGYSVVQARFSLGPGRLNLPCRTLLITSKAEPQVRRIIIRPGVQDFCVRTLIGVNEMTLAVEEEARSFLPTDNRPLLLRVDELQMAPVALFTVGTESDVPCHYTGPATSEAYISVHK